MLQHTDLIVAMIDAETESLAAFARVLTDEVYWALLFDVIVHPSHRASGLGDQLIREVLAHGRVQKVRSIALCCKPELVDFYSRWGFEVQSPPDVVWMRRKLPDQNL